MAYNGKAVVRLGLTLVVLGTISMILGITAVAMFSTKDVAPGFHLVGGPIWSGAFVLVTGAVGVFSGRKPTNKCWTVALMVMAILAIFPAVASMFLAVGGAVDGSSHCYNYDYAQNHGSITIIPCGPSNVALHVVNAILSFVEVVLGFVVSIMCCCCGLPACCCCGQPASQSTSTAHSAFDNQGMLPGGFVVMQTGAVGTQPGGTNQQISIAQDPSGAQVPVQVYYTATPQPYHLQYVPSAAGGAGAPPMETKTQIDGAN